MCTKEYTSPLMALGEQELNKAMSELQMGNHIQNVLPNMSATNRESLISGMCESCQDELFNPNFDDDEDE